MKSKPESTLLKNGIYNITGGLIKIALGVAAIPILIRSLGMEEYGLWTLASSVLGVVNLAEAGLSTATTVFVSQDLSKDDFTGVAATISVSLLSMLFLATVSGLLLYQSSGVIVSWYPSLSISQSIMLSQSLQVGGLVVWSKLLQQALIGIEQAYQRYDIVNIVSTLSSVFTSIGMIAIAGFSGKMIHLMLYQMLSSIVFLLIHCCVVRRIARNISLSFSFDISKAFDIGKYSLMMWITSLGSVLFTRVDRLVIGYTLGSKSLGIYSAITDVAVQINVLSGIAVQPLISSIANEGDIKSLRVKKQVRKSMVANLYISLTLGLLFNTIAPLLLSTFLKQDIANIDNSYVMSFRLGILIYSLYSVNSFGYYVLIGAKKVEMCSRISLIVGFSTIVIIYLGAINLGLIGGILGNAGFLGVCLFTFTSMAAVGIPFSSYFRDLVYPILYVITTFIVTLFINLNLSQSVFLLSASLVLLSISARNSIYKINS
jgi:O-antigen/teichoic acid export membrane protein